MENRGNEFQVRKVNNQREKKSNAANKIQNLVNDFII